MEAVGFCLRAARAAGRRPGGGAGRRKRLIAVGACGAAARPSRWTRAAAPAWGRLLASSRAPSPCGCRGGRRRHPSSFLLTSQLAPGFSHGLFCGRLGRASVAAGCAPQGAGRRAASGAGLAAAVSMVTAPPAAGPLGEDAACRARRLAPGLSVRRGSLRSGGPAGSLPGCRHQVSLPRGGGGRGRASSGTCYPRIHTCTGWCRGFSLAAAPISPYPHPHFFLANTPRKSNSWRG